MKLLTSALLCIAILHCAWRAAGAEIKPNFIVILTDDQSWVGTSLKIDPDDEESCSDYYRTPHIERLAASGMRFTDGYAPAPAVNRQESYS